MKIIQADVLEIEKGIIAHQVNQLGVIGRWTSTSN